MTVDLGPAFLADILADPADRAARLIYADWLDDHRGDDPAARDRAKFIRAQCAAETLDPGDPAWRVARFEADRLLARHEADWAGPVGHLVRGWRFRGGFIEQVKAAPGVLHNAGPRLVGLVPLRALALRRAGGGWARLMSCPLLPRIDDLEVNSAFPRGSTRWLSHLAESPRLGRLRRLTLARNALPVGGGTRLGHGGLDGLRELILGHGVVTGGVLDELARTPLARRVTRLAIAAEWNDAWAVEVLRATDWPALAALTLSGLDCTEAVAERLATVPWLGQVRELTLSAMHAGALGVLAETAALGERLERLALTGSSTGQGRGSDPLPLGRWPNLRVLTLGCGCGDVTLAALRREPALPRLHTLELDGAKLRGRALDALLATLDRSPIRQLSLASADLGDVEVERLARQPSLAGVQELDLSGVPFAERGVAALLASPHVHGLLRLTVRHCPGMTGPDRRRLRGRFPIVEVR